MKSVKSNVIAIGGHRYVYDGLNPMDAIDWGNRVIGLFGPLVGDFLESGDMSGWGAILEFDSQKDDMAELCRVVQPVLGQALKAFGGLNAVESSRLLTEAIQRCYTPDSQSLSDMTVFNSWFREHPGDLFPLGIISVIRLVRDFFSNAFVTGTDAFQDQNMTEAEAPRQ